MRATIKSMLQSRLPYALIAVGLALGWASRERTLAAERAAILASQTIALGKVAMAKVEDRGKFVGKNGVYLAGDTPASTNFVTGRFVIEPGQTPHLPHTHPEEEVMIIESGTGEISVDGRITPVGPGSVMYTAPQVSHGIVNTGTEPVVFYYIKWAAKPAG
jgi:mannose-6-phosphate isomerase-like protein (cupin superfamily)